MFDNGSQRYEQALQRTFYRQFLPSFVSFDQVVSEEKMFLNQPIRKKNCLWRPCQLTDRNKFSNLYRRPSIDASYQVGVHLAKRFQRKCFFQKLTNQKQELSMAAMFVNVSGRNSNLYRGPSIDASYEVSVHLATRSQRGRFLKIGQSETRIACGGHVC